MRFVRDGASCRCPSARASSSRSTTCSNEVGVDAARWFFASRAPSTGIDFDIELARKQSSENPVYYVQYAHARIASILRKADRRRAEPADSLAGTLATDEVALGLAKELLRLPDIVRDAAAERETQAITAFATELATKFHAYYRDRRVVDAEDPETSGGAPRARRRDAHHARPRTRAAGDQRARVDVGATAAQPAQSSVRASVEAIDDAHGPCRSAADRAIAPSNVG